MDLLSPKDVAEVIGDVTPDTARLWMMNGKLPGAQPLGSTYVIERPALDEALEHGLERKSRARLTNGWPWLTSRETHDMLEKAGLGVSHVTVLDWLRKGVLPGQKVGKAWAVPRERLERMIAEGFEVPARGRPPDDAG